MKMYEFYKIAESGERFNLEDEKQNDIIVLADSEEEAEEIIKSMYEEDGNEQLKDYLPASEIEKLPCCFSIWYIANNGEYKYIENLENY